MAMAGGKRRRPGQWAVWAAQAVAAAVGLNYGYAFGQEISGPVLGVVLAANTAVFGAMGVTALADLAERLRSSAGKPARPPR